MVSWRISTAVKCQSTKRKQNVDVIADHTMNYIRLALNVCVALSRYVLFILFL